MSHAKTKHGHSCCDLDASNPSALVARCGGPAICRQCAIDAAGEHQWKEAPTMSMAHTALKIRIEALERLAEIGDAHGCEASSATAYEHGRLSVLNELGLGLGTITTMTEPESTEATEASADEAEAANDDDATEADEASAE